jgi:hypothetical protein
MTIETRHVKFGMEIDANFDIVVSEVICPFKMLVLFY